MRSFIVASLFLTLQNAWSGTQGLHQPTLEQVEAINRHRVWLRDGKHQPDDPRRADFSGQVLARINLGEQNLYGAKLNKVVFAGANLSGATLNEAELREADFSGAKLDCTTFGDYTTFGGADLTRASLVNANLQGAYFGKSILTNANFTGSNLTGTNFERATLTGAMLNGTPLNAANFNGANLTRAKLHRAALGGANFLQANLYKATIALNEVQKLDVQHWLLANGLSTIKMESPFTVATLSSLREELKKAGFVNEERALTAALWRYRAKQSPWPERAFRVVAFDFPVEYGNAPGRALLAAVIGILLFTIPYAVAMRRVSQGPAPKGAIWRVWSKDRIVDGRLEPEEACDRLILSTPKALLYGLFFSLLSAFHFGWRDLNVGSWISRIQPNEYALRPTGWVRVVSGVQSLLSVYLVALWALSYFGRPFE